jgi:acetyl esterase/lipase
MFGSATAGSAQSSESAQQTSARLQEQLGARSLASLRNVPADRILQAQLSSQARFGPAIDGYVLPASPAEIFASGKHSDVPALLGFTQDESFSELARATTLTALRDATNRMYGDQAEKLLALYPARTDAEARRAATDAARDSTVGLQMHEWARLQTANGKAPVYGYLFSRVHPYAPGITFADHDPATVGAYHTADVPYWLGTLESLNLFRTTRNWTDLDRELSTSMMDALVAFISTGNPNAPRADAWPRYRVKQPQIRELGDSQRTIAWPNLRQLEFFAKTPAASSATPAASPTRAEPKIGERPVLEDRYPERRTTFPGGVVGLADLTYSTVPGYRPLTLDLYRSANSASPRPLVIYVHGGGWQSGHTRHSGAFENWPDTLASIAARGYVVASLEYRLSGEAPFPAAIQDVKAAIRWLRNHSREHGIDPARVVIWGGSAGGQLAALAGTSCGVKPLDPKPASPETSDCVQGVIAWYGIFDFEALARSPEAMGADGAAAADSAPSRYLGCTLPKCAPAILQSASAASYLDAQDAPFLLIHGDGDRVVPVAQSRDFLARLKKSGVSAELLEFPEVDHSFIGRNADATRRASVQAFEKSLAFIERVTSGH